MLEHSAIGLEPFVVGGKGIAEQRLFAVLRQGPECDQRSSAADAPAEHVAEERVDVARELRPALLGKLHDPREFRARQRAQRGIVTIAQAFVPDGAKLARVTDRDRRQRVCTGALGGAHQLCKAFARLVDSAHANAATRGAARPQVGEQIEDAADSLGLALDGGRGGTDEHDQRDAQGHALPEIVQLHETITALGLEQLAGDFLNQERTRGKRRHAVVVARSHGVARKAVASAEQAAHQARFPCATLAEHHHHRELARGRRQLTQNFAPTAGRRVRLARRLLRFARATTEKKCCGQQRAHDQHADRDEHPGQTAHGARRSPSGGWLGCVSLSSSASSTSSSKSS